MKSWCLLPDSFSCLQSALPSGNTTAHVQNVDVSSVEWNVIITLASVLTKWNVVCVHFTSAFRSQAMCMLLMHLWPVLVENMKSSQLSTSAECMNCWAEWTVRDAELEQSFGGCSVSVQLLIPAMIISRRGHRSLLYLGSHSLLQLWCQFTFWGYLLSCFSFSMFLYAGTCGLHCCHLWNRAESSAHLNRGNL